MSTVFLPVVEVVKQAQGKINGSFIDEEFVLTFVVKGNIDFRIGESIHKVGQNQVVLIPPHMPHAVSPVNSEEIILDVIHFSTTIMDDHMRCWPRVMEMKSADRKELSLLIQKLKSEYVKSKVNKYILTGLMLQILGLCCEQNEDVKEAFPKSELKPKRNMRQVVLMFHENYKDPYRVQNIAKSIGLSTCHFSRLFKDYTGDSPYQYLCKVRVEYAKKLLMSGKFNCTEIAEQVGFSSIHVFSKTFRRICSYSPKNWVGEFVSR